MNNSFWGSNNLTNGSPKFSAEIAVNEFVKSINNVNQRNVGNLSQT
jgi:hypothetical protein